MGKNPEFAILEHFKCIWYVNWQVFWVNYHNNLACFEGNYPQYCQFAENKERSSSEMTHD